MQLPYADDVQYETITRIAAVKVVSPDDMPSDMLVPWCGKLQSDGCHAVETGTYFHIRKLRHATPRHVAAVPFHQVMQKKCTSYLNTSSSDKHVSSVFRHMLHITATVTRIWTAAGVLMRYTTVRQFIEFKCLLNASSDDRYYLLLFRRTDNSIEPMNKPNK